VLYPVDQDDSLVLEDLVDDPVVAAPGGMQSLEFPEQWLSETLWVLRFRTQDRRKSGLSCLLRKTVQVSKTLRGDLDFIHTRFLSVVLEPKPLAASGLVT
jgi:hypothetical protein